MLNSAQELGAAIGVTVLGAIATAATISGDSAALAGGYRVGLLVAAAIVAVSLVLIARLVPPRPAPRGLR